MRHSLVIGSGLHVPRRKVTNSELDQLYQRDLSCFLETKRGIFERYWLSAGEAGSDLIVPAAEQAMRKAGISAEELDLIIVATDTPDYISPATSAVVQHRLGAIHAGIFDVNAACAGFVTALDIASRYLEESARYKHALVVGAYGISTYFDPEDYKVVSVFADGAGAVILKASTELKRGILASELQGFGQYHDYMGIYAGGTREPFSAAVLENHHHKLSFRKRIPSETNPTLWPPLIRTLCDRAQVNIDEIKRFFFTQINLESIQESMSVLERPCSLAHIVMDRYGYTGSACLPMALADAEAQGLLEPGDVSVLVGSGGGMALAGMLIRW
ncbi:MAG: 3-oxoacyl-ACP synthase III family protein [Oligoflexus sp.]